MLVPTWGIKNVPAKVIHIISQSRNSFSLVDVVYEVVAPLIYNETRTVFFKNKVGLVELTYRGYDRNNKIIQIGIGQAATTSFQKNK